MLKLFRKFIVLSMICAFTLSPLAMNTSFVATPNVCKQQLQPPKQRVRHNMNGDSRLLTENCIVACIALQRVSGSVNGNCALNGTV